MKKIILLGWLLSCMQSSVMASVGHYANKILKLETVVFEEQLYSMELQLDADGLWSLRSQGELQTQSNEQPTARWQTETAQLHIPLVDAKIGNRWFQYKDVTFKRNDKGRFVLNPLIPNPIKPHFRNTECPYNDIEKTNVQCGFLVAPMNHQKPDYRAVHVAVAILKSRTQPAKADPLVYLPGGPGGQALDSVPYYVNDPYLKDRDMIFLDPRGLGLSEPNLVCHELDKAVMLIIGQESNETKIATYLAALRQCRQRLTTEVVDDLTVFNSKQNAADLETLRKVLNIEQWNLLGTSYGTRWALTAMRDYPAGIRSVILDSPVPLQMDLDSITPTYIQQSFDLLFNACEKDATCNKESPNLKQRFLQLVEKLNKTPEIYQLEAYADEQGNVPTFLLTGDFTVSLLRNALYVKELIPFLPLFINIIEQGKADLILDLVAGFAMGFYLQDSINSGVYYSTICREETAFNDENTYLQNTDNKLLNNLIQFENPFRLCKEWNIEAADEIENQAVKSDIPSLILAGEYDPVTPPVLGEILKQDLSQSHFFTLPGVSHGVTDDECGLNISMEFLNQPQAETISASSCIADLKPPQFTFSLFDLIKLFDE